MPNHYLFTKIIFFLLLFNNLTYAQIEKVTIKVPIHIKAVLAPGEKIKYKDGTTITDTDVYQEILVDIYKDKKINRGPYLIFNHGTSIGYSDSRDSINSKKMQSIGIFFASNGFITIIPIRAGYGESGGPQGDYKGTCSKPKIIEGMKNMTNQNLKVLEYVKNITYINTNEGLIAGISGGGGLSIAMTSENIPGLKGVINFAGAILDTYSQPKINNKDEFNDTNCATEETKLAFKYYGSLSKVPSLWLYSINDKITGITKPMEWFESFQRANYIPKGKFEFLSSYKLNGHDFIYDGKIWIPEFNKFLKEINFSTIIK